MGWSCAAVAGRRLEAISNKCVEQTKSQNVFIANNNRYFYEVGREQHDGAICGIIHKFVDNNMVRRSGSFRIERDGKISRGPKFFKDIPFKYIYVPDFQIIELWEGGTIEEWVQAHLRVNPTSRMPRKVELKDENGIVETWIAPMFLAI